MAFAAARPLLVKRSGIKHGTIRAVDELVCQVSAVVEGQLRPLGAEISRGDESGGCKENRHTYAVDPVGGRETIALVRRQRKSEGVEAVIVAGGAVGDVPGRAGVVQLRCIGGAV